MEEGGELLYLFSHATVPKGCYTNIQTLLSLVTQLFKTSMEKQNLTHHRIPEMAYGYNAETRIAKLYSRGIVISRYASLCITHICFAISLDLIQNVS